MKVFDEYMLVFTEDEIAKARKRWLREISIHKSLENRKKRR